SSASRTTHLTARRPTESAYDAGMATMPTTATGVTSFDELAWDDPYLRALPADPIDDPQPRQVDRAAYSRVQPTPVAAPRTLAWSPELAAQLGLAPALCESQAFADVLAGNRVPAGADPYAMAYGGHQFGSWA